MVVVHKKKCSSVVVGVQGSGQLGGSLVHVETFPFSSLWRGSWAGTASKSARRVDNGSRGENFSNFPVNRLKTCGVGPLESRGRPEPARDPRDRSDFRTCDGALGGQGGSPGRAHARLLAPAGSFPRSWKRGSRGCRVWEFPIGCV